MALLAPRGPGFSSNWYLQVPAADPPVRTPEPRALVAFTQKHRGGR
jgi:hypothetical protein